MGILLDMAGALLVRGAIIGIMLTVTVTLNEVLYFKTASRTIQMELSSMVEVVESDLRKAGYNVTTGQTFSQVDTSELTFMADVDTNGTPESVHYYLGSTTELNGTPNPNDRQLWREINGQPKVVGAGLTKFFLTYYTMGGQPTADSSLIGSVGIEIWLEHGYFTYSDRYPRTHWTRRLYPTNL